VQLDKNGNFKKDKTIGGSGDDTEVWCLEKTSDGGYIFGGRSTSDISGEKTENSRGYYDYWVIKLDKSLNIQWDKTLGGDNFDAMYSVKEDKKNRYVVAGESWSDISGDKTEPSRGYGDYWLVWLSDKGEQQDKKIITSVNKSAISPLRKEKIFAVYPNPVRDLINVHTEAKATVTLTDQSGKILLTKVIDGSGVIKVSSFTPGIYYLKSDHTTAVQKVIVTK
ncbi:MAG: T9SS type A sorting domain-containing protein, partial [Ginsengibacter sp.]